MPVAPTLLEAGARRANSSGNSKESEFAVNRPWRRWGNLHSWGVAWFIGQRSRLSLPISGQRRRLAERPAGSAARRSHEYYFGIALVRH